MNPLTIIYIVIVLLSLIDISFTFWYLRNLISHGVKNVHNRELNPIGRWLFRTFGYGPMSFLIMFTYVQVLIYVVSSLTPIFYFCMMGTYLIVMMYHYGIYKELEFFKDDKRYWSFVRWKLKRLTEK